MFQIVIWFWPQTSFESRSTDLVESLLISYLFGETSDRPTRRIEQMNSQKIGAITMHLVSYIYCCISASPPTYSMVRHHSGRLKYDSLVLQCHTGLLFPNFSQPSNIIAVLQLQLIYSHRQITISIYTSARPLTITFTLPIALRPPHRSPPPTFLFLRQ